MIKTGLAEEGVGGGMASAKETGAEQTGTPPGESGRSVGGASTTLDETWALEAAELGLAVEDGRPAWATAPLELPLPLPEQIRELRKLQSSLWGGV